MIALLAACTTPEATPTQAVYRLSWREPEAVEVREDVLHLRTDLGFDVELTEARVVAYTTMLKPCPRTVGLSWMGSTAYAGHSAMGEASASRVPTVENLLDPRDLELPTVSLGHTGYCAAETLIARGDANIEPPSMRGASLRLVGRWSKDHGRTWTPLEVVSPIAHGTSAPLDGMGTGRTLEVTVSRSVDGLLDGIALDTEPAPRIARDALKNLVSTIRFSQRTL